MGAVRLMLAGACLVLSGTVAAQSAAPFCLVSDSGHQSCFYYSLQACRQAAVSLGGMCSANSRAQNVQQPSAATLYQQYSPLDVMKHVQDAGEAGRREGERQREARLRAELLEAQIERERAEAARAAQPQPQGSTTALYKCVGLDGIPLYSPAEMPDMSCSRVIAAPPQVVVPPKGWRPHDQGNGRAVFLREDWRINGAIVDIWMLTDYEKARQPPGISGWFNSAIGLLRLDCDKDLIATIYVVLYRGRVGEGGVLTSYDYQSPDWEPVVPDSLGESVRAMTCGSGPTRE